MPSRLRTLEYVVEVAKDWTIAGFAAAQTSDFALAPHRFELLGAAVQRRALSASSIEAQSPLDAVRRARRPTAWAHSTVVTTLADTETGTIQYEHEVVEIVAMHDEEVVAECASVVRIEGFPPCLGPFWS
jgi:hypothetical protein